MLLQGKSIFYDLFCLILTTRCQTAISACEIHFSVVIWIQSVTDANDILAPNLPLSLFNPVRVSLAPSTALLCLCCHDNPIPVHPYFSPQATTRCTVALFVSAPPRSRSLSSLATLTSASPPWATEQTHDVRGHYLIWIHDILWLSLSALSQPPGHILLTCFLETD